MTEQNPGGLGSPHTMCAWRLDRQDEILKDHEGRLRKIGQWRAAVVGGFVVGQAALGLFWLWLSKIIPS